MKAEKERTEEDRERNRKERESKRKWGKKERKEERKERRKKRREEKREETSLKYLPGSKPNLPASRGNIKDSLASRCPFQKVDATSVVAPIQHALIPPSWKEGDKGKVVPTNIDTYHFKQNIGESASSPETGLPSSAGCARTVESKIAPTATKRSILVFIARMRTL